MGTKSDFGKRIHTIRVFSGNPARVAAVLGAFAFLAAGSPGMDVAEEGTRLVVSGANFRYTWDTRRGGELTTVEQRGLETGGWWKWGGIHVSTDSFQRVNSSFAWKSRDTIPALSFATRRMAYYSGDWNIAYASADKKATLKILKKSARELIFDTASAPKILENQRVPVPWKVSQHVRVLDSGVILLSLKMWLPENDCIYELDWCEMGVNMDDILYKEPNPTRQASFGYGWGFADETNLNWTGGTPALQGPKHLPIDIDLDLSKSNSVVITGKPILFGRAGYDLTHVMGSAQNGFMECSLDEAISIMGTRGDFGSHVIIRPLSGMSGVPTEAGSMRFKPCLGIMWNLFDGATQGLNEPRSYENRLTLAFGSRKRSSSPEATGDDRNILLGARVYYARDSQPAEGDLAAMAAEGCDTLILGTYWQTDPAATAALVEKAHASGLRVGGTVSIAKLKDLVKDDAWFTKCFKKDRDGLLVLNASVLGQVVPEGEMNVLGEKGEKVKFAYDGPLKANAAAFATCMRALREIVGPKGFLIGDPGKATATLLSLAEFDLRCSTDSKAFKSGTPQGRCNSRYNCSAGYAPVVSAMDDKDGALAAIHDDTPIILWPAPDKKHVAWWSICKKLPQKGFRVESDLMAAERHFTISSPSVHGSFFDAGQGKGILLLAAEKEDSAKVTLTWPSAKVKALEGPVVAVESDLSFNAGAFTPWQIKAFEVGYESGTKPESK